VSILTTGQNDIRAHDQIGHKTESKMATN